MKTALPRYTCKSRSTFIRSLIPRKHEQVKMRVQAALREVKCISLTSDAWSSSENTHSLLSLTAHFLDSKFKPQHAVIGAFCLKGSHTGFNMGSVISSALDDYGLTDKVHLLIRDGASSMVKASECANLHSAHCFAHILQLVVKDALSVSQSMEVIESLKKIVRKIRKSGTDRTAFLDTALQLDMSPVMLTKHVEVRWSSLYQMLSRFIEQKDAVEMFLIDHSQYPQLSTCDWLAISRLREFLKPLHAIVTRIQCRKYASISTVIPLYKVIRAQYDSMSDVNHVRIKFLESLDRRMLEYFSSTPQAGIATLLDPRFKMSYFDDDEKKKYREALFESAIDYFSSLAVEIELGHGEDIGLIHNDVIVTSPKEKDDVDKMFDYFLEASETVTPPQSSHGVFDLRQKLNVELDEYLEVQSSYRLDVAEFWADPVHAAKFPLISDLIRKYLSAPATSAESERLFSTAGYILSDLRKTLSRSIFIKLNNHIVD